MDNDLTGVYYAITGNIDAYVELMEDKHELLCDLYRIKSLAEYYINELESTKEQENGRTE